MTKTRTRLVPAEWAPHAAMWLAFPSAADLWLDDLVPAQDEVAALVRAMATTGGEHVKLLVGASALDAARARLGDLDTVQIIPADFGDIWVRDTGPIFSGVGAQRFRFNGWGGKYELEHDDTIGDVIVGAHPVAHHDLVLEGGALDHDGAGTILTTRQCLLNPNRNGTVDETFYEAAFATAFGATRVIWLGDGLENDHTDGHVDNLARFVGPNRVAVPMASGTDDPNAACFAAVKADLLAAGFDVVEIPSPGRVLNDDGDVVPASHMNFIICNRAVIVPTYNEHGAAAVAAVQAIFPDHAVIGLSSNAILTGGGSFHCITQQEP